MSEGTGAPAEGEQTPNNTDPTPANSSPAPELDLRSKFGELESNFNRLVEKLDALTLPRQQEAQTSMDPEAFKKLLAENPAEAIKYAVKDVVKAEVSPVERKFKAETDKKYYDAKAYTDFPQLDRDTEFQKLVNAQARELILTDGLTKDHPTLLYRAAQLAALKYTKKSETPAKAKAGSDTVGEAPSRSGERPRESKVGSVDTKTIDALAKIFGMNDESKKRFIEKQKAKGAL